MGQSLTFEFFDFLNDPPLRNGLELQDDVAQVWRRNLRADPCTLEHARGVLSEEERERASRYRVEPPRTAFILTRSALRILLGGYLGESPRSIRFRVTKYGKLFLDGRFDLHFNVSHTDGLALLAFARKRRIGVDTEKIRPQPDALKLARRFFSERERLQLEKLPAEELAAAFFRCWSRKEAYIKARGEGLSHPLNQFDVSAAANPGEILLATRPDATEAQRWVLGNVPVPPQYVAALAVSCEE